MTKQELHYLNCSEGDGFCDNFACVARRQFERTIKEIEADRDARAAKRKALVQVAWRYRRRFRTNRDLKIHCMRRRELLRSTLAIARQELIHCKLQYLSEQMGAEMHDGNPEHWKQCYERVEKTLLRIDELSK